MGIESGTSRSRVRRFAPQRSTNNGRPYAVQLHTVSWILPPLALKPGTSHSEVRSANHSATWSLQKGFDVLESKQKVRLANQSWKDNQLSVKSLWSIIISSQCRFGHILPVCLSMTLTICYILLYVFGPTGPSKQCRPRWDATNVASHQGLYCLPLIQLFFDTTFGSKLYLFKC